MNCKFCNSAKALRVSHSKDRWYFRLLLGKYVRCHKCGYAFLAPMWQSFPTFTARRRQPVEVPAAVPSPVSEIDDPQRQAA